MGNEVSTVKYNVVMLSFMSLFVNSIFFKLFNMTSVG